MFEQFIVLCYPKWSFKRRVQIFAAMLQPHSVSRNAAWDMPSTGVTPKSHVCPKPMDLHLQVSWSWNITLYFVCSKVCLDWRSWSWSILQEVQLGWHQCNVCPIPMFVLQQTKSKGFCLVLEKGSKKFLEWNPWVIPTIEEQVCLISPPGPIHAQSHAQSYDSSEGNTSEFTQSVGV